MALQRSLKLAGYALLALTILCIFALPGGVVPMAICAAVAGLAGLDLLALLLLTLIRERSFRGLVQVLLYASLLLLVVGGFGSQMMSNSIMVESGQGETAQLYGLGMNDYTLTLESVDGTSLYDAELEVVLTRPDQVSIHETISQSEPLVYDGIEVHPLAVDPLRSLLYVQYDWFRHLIVAGGVLFLISLALSTIPAVRRKGGE